MWGRHPIVSALLNQEMEWSRETQQKQKQKQKQQQVQSTQQKPTPAPKHNQQQYGLDTKHHSNVGQINSKNAMSQSTLIQPQFQTVHTFQAQRPINHFPMQTRTSRYLIYHCERL